MLGVYCLTYSDNGLNSVRIRFYIVFSKLFPIVFQWEGTCQEEKSTVVLSEEHRKANLPKSTGWLPMPYQYLR